MLVLRNAMNQNKSRQKKKKKKKVQELVESHIAYYYSKWLEKFYSEIIKLSLLKPLFPKFI